MDATTSAGLIVGIVLIALVRSKKNTDLLIWAGVIAMTIVPYQDSEGKIQTGILSIREAFAALTNEGVIAIAALFIVAAGVKETGFLGALLEASFKRKKKTLRYRIRESSCSILFYTNLFCFFFR